MPQKWSGVTNRWTTNHWTGLESLFFALRDTKFQEVTSEYVHLESAKILKFDSAEDFA